MQSADSADAEDHRDRPPDSRRTFLRRAGLGMAGAVGGVALAGAGAAGATHYRHVQAARRRGESSTVTTLSAATSLRVLWRADTAHPVAALTFDDGPGAEHTPTLLDVLEAAEARATFAVVGREAARFPDLVRRQHAAGHELANHSWSHADLGLHDYDGCRRELDRTDDLLTQLTGAPSRVIRPPYGRVSGGLLQHAAQRGQQLALWDMRLLEDEFDAAGNAAYVLDHLRPGSIVLAHDAGAAKRAIGMAAIPAILAGAAERGFSFVTLSELLALDGAPAEPIRDSMTAHQKDPQ